MSETEPWQALVNDLQAELDQGHLTVWRIVERHRAAIQRAERRLASIPAEPEQADAPRMPWAMAGHCVSIDGDRWHEPGTCRDHGSTCCGPAEPEQADEVVGLDVEAIRERAAAATPGPWLRVTEGNASVEQLGHRLLHDLMEPLAEGIPANTDATYVRTDDDTKNVTFVGNGPRQTENGDFIAHARTDIPALLAEVDRLARANARLAPARDDTSVDCCDCPKCGEWRDSPTADCAACGFAPARDDTSGGAS